MHVTAMPAPVTAVVIVSVCVQPLLRMVTSGVSMVCQSNGEHKNSAVSVFRFNQGREGGRERVRVVRGPDLKSVGREFKSRSDC